MTDCEYLGGTFLMCPSCESTILNMVDVNHNIEDCITTTSVYCMCCRRTHKLILKRHKGTMKQYWEVGDKVCIETLQQSRERSPTPERGRVGFAGMGVI